MTYEDLMVEIGALLGLENFRPDEDGYCELESEDATFSFQNCPEIGEVLLTAPVCEIAADESPAFLRAVLEANCMFEGTAGATLSIDRETNALLLCRHDALATETPDAYQRKIEAFAAILMRWRERHQDFGVAPEGGSGSSAGVGMKDFA